MKTKKQTIARVLITCLMIHPILNFAATSAQSSGWKDSTYNEREEYTCATFPWVFVIGLAINWLRTAATAAAIAFPAIATRLTQAADKLQKLADRIAANNGVLPCDAGSILAGIKDDLNGIAATGDAAIDAALGQAMAWINKMIEVLSMAPCEECQGTLGILE